MATAFSRFCEAKTRLARSADVVQARDGRNGRMPASTPAIDPEADAHGKPVFAREGSETVRERRRRRKPIGIAGRIHRSGYISIDPRATRSEAR